MYGVIRGYLGFVLLVGVGIAHAESRGYMFCEMEVRFYGEDRCEGYVSNVFYVSSSYDNDVRDDYADFVNAKYSPDGQVYNVTCEYHERDTEREAEAERLDVISGYKASSCDVRKVRWHY